MGSLRLHFMGDLIPNMPFLSIALPPGFKFRPWEEELLCYYLKNKQDHDQLLLQNPSDSSSADPQILLLDVIQEIDFYGYDPCDFPESACFAYGDGESNKRWYFLTPKKQERRLRRTEIGGYWKGKRGGLAVVNGKEGAVVGTRRTFCFYRGEFPHGKKTDWVMKEYELVAVNAETPPVPTKDPLVLCCVGLKSRAGKKILKHGASSHDEDNLAAPFNNYIGGIREVVAEEDIQDCKGDEVHHLFMTLTDEPDKTVALQPVDNGFRFLVDIPQPEHLVQFPNGFIKGGTNNVTNELINSVILEGGFLELNDLRLPLSDSDSSE